MLADQLDYGSLRTHRGKPPTQLLTGPIPPPNSPRAILSVHRKGLAGSGRCDIQFVSAKRFCFSITEGGRTIRRGINEFLRCVSGLFPELNL